MHYFRQPKTSNEKRAWGKYRFETKEGFKVRTRSGRGPRRIPCSWWDINRPYNEKNWKKYRKTQYKY